MYFCCSLSLYHKKSDKDLISLGGFGSYMDHEVYSFFDSTQIAIRNLNIDLDELAREVTERAIQQYSH